MSALRRVFSYSSGKYHVFGEDVVSVCFSRSGQHLFTMQRRQLPYLYQTTRPNVAIRFMDEKGDYMNSVTMKSGCFVGTNDEVCVCVCVWVCVSVCVGVYGCDR